MNSRRWLRVAIALVAAVTARASVAAPSLATAELRALSCCAGHCDQPMPMRAAKSCCQVSSAAGDPSLAATGTSVGQSTTLAAALPAARAPEPPALRAAAPRPAPHATAPPLFLRIRSLRL